MINLVCLYQLINKLLNHNFISNNDSLCSTKGVMIKYNTGIVKTSIIFNCDFMVNLFCSDIVNIQAKMQNNNRAILKNLSKKVKSEQPKLARERIRIQKLQSLLYFIKNELPNFLYSIQIAINGPIIANCSRNKQN